jgi:serine/threonine protein kinase
MTLAMGRLPIDTQGGYWTILNSIRDNPPPKLPESKFSVEFCDFLNKCMLQDPCERYTCEQLLSHNFLEKAFIDEDIVDEESQTKGIEELENILTALLQHVRRTKSATNQSFHSSKNTSNVSNENSDSDFSSGGYYYQLRTTSTPDFLRYLLLRNFNLESPQDELSSCILHYLSHQLHLPCEKVISVVTFFCNNLKDDEDEDYIPTPKASHSK